MKLIALDVGTKRIGVAKADSKVRIAVPYSAIEVNGGEEFKKIASLSRAWDVQNFVIGMPRNSKGQETKQSLYVRAFAKELKRVIPEAKICFQDESLTSVEAETRLSKRKKGYKKGDIDSEAATIILQDFLEEKTGKSTTRAAAARSKSVKGVKPNRLATVIIALAAIIVLAGALAVFYYFYSLGPISDADCSDPNTISEDCSDIILSVNSGASVPEVADELAEKGLIRNNFTFQIYFKFNTNGDPIKAGEYHFNRTMNVEKISGLLIHGSDSVYSFTSLPGSTVRNVRQSLIALGYSSSEVNDALNPSKYRDGELGWLFAGMPEDATSLEGYLYGDTYEFYRDDSAETIVKRLLQELGDIIKKNRLEAKFNDQGLNLYQGITLASIIQREAGSAADMPKIAKVFYNRLYQPDAETQGLLGSDVTAIYAVDLVDPNRQTYTSPGLVIDIDSPYNTRKYAGLPYGPVSNPGLDALLATAAPDESLTALYFLAGDDGLTYFADNDAEHQQNIVDHCQELCNIDI